MKQRIRSAAPRYIVAGLYLVFIFLLLKRGVHVQEKYHQVSLRYNEQKISSEMAADIKYYATQKENKTGLIPTFWYQEAERVFQNDSGSIAAKVVSADGEMADILPVKFLTGDYPSLLDKTGLALSEEVAWRLFGTNDIIGNELKWNDKTYYVRGVFEQNEPMVLVQVDAGRMPSGAKFTGVELWGLKNGDPRLAAETFIQGSGLHQPEAIVNYSGMSSLLAFSFYIPVCILVLWFFVKLSSLINKKQFWVRQIYWGGVLLFFAIMIPKALDLLPGWMIPTNWSDFTFWENFGKELNNRFTEWLALAPSYKDVLLKKEIIKQIIVLFAAMATTVTMIRYWSANATAKAEKAKQIQQESQDSLDADAELKQEQQDESDESQDTPQENTPDLLPAFELPS